MDRIIDTAKKIRVKDFILKRLGCKTKLNFATIHFCVFRFNSILTILILFSYSFVFSQEESNSNPNGTFNAFLTTQTGFFIRDSNIGAIHTPQYDHQLYGGQSWLDAMYSNWGFEFGVRLDYFQNSNLINPLGSFNKQGIGRWFIRKEDTKFGFEAGYIYDQIGTGIIYRAYEARTQGLDNALQGVKLNLNINQNWHLKAFAGKQKKQFDVYESLIKGIALDGFVKASDTSHFSMAPGLGIVNRTIDDASLDNALATIATYPKANQFLPRYNTYACTLYDQINAGNFTLYLESAFKSNDVFNDPNALRQDDQGNLYQAPTLIHKSGHVLYGSINYVKSSFGLTLEAKRTQYFSFRTRPQEEANNGLISFIPPMSRQQSYNLLSFYQPATQEIGESAFKGELQFNLGENEETILHISHINDLNQNKLYREYYAEGSSRKKNRTILASVQYREYNQQVYEGKPNAPLVKTFVLNLDGTFKLNEVRALRVNLETMTTKQDQGNWISILAEYSIAPKWIFTLSDMYNGTKKKNYNTAMVTYSHLSNRVSLGWVRQRAGIVCTGGICRYEPAFNGIKFNLEARF